MQIKVEPLLPEALHTGDFSLMNP